MLQLKVCGINDYNTLIQLNALEPNYLGFIFYEPSPRCLTLDKTVLRNVNPSILKIGVFVNEDYLKVVEKCKLFNLQGVQLHGEESIEYLILLKSLLPELIISKAFLIDYTFDFNQLLPYSDLVDYFLFDSKSDLYGGSGKKFNWQKLEEYNLNKPFFLSGGIEVNDLNKIKEINHPQFIGVDINSKFEIAPGIKNIELIKKFKEQLI